MIVYLSPTLKSNLSDLIQVVAQESPGYPGLSSFLDESDALRV